MFPGRAASEIGAGDNYGFGMKVGSGVETLQDEILEKKRLKRFSGVFR
jgi:hypothetical protein